MCPSFSPDFRPVPVVSKIRVSWHSMASSSSHQEVKCTQKCPLVFMIQPGRWSTWPISTQQSLVLTRLGFLLFLPSPTTSSSSLRQDESRCFFSHTIYLSLSVCPCTKSHGSNWLTDWLLSYCMLSLTKKIDRVDGEQKKLCECVQYTPSFLPSIHIERPTVVQTTNKHERTIECTYVRN